MKTWKQYVLLNLAAAVGVFASLFVVPENTSIRLWATVSIVAVVLMNAGLYLRRKLPPQRKWNGGTAMIWVGFFLLVLDILFSRTLVNRLP
jgi:hypothetical protein